MNLSDLEDKPGIVFLSTPYTKYWLGLICAATDAARAAAALRRRNINVFSPIAHGDTVSRRGGLDPTDADMWMHNDRAILEIASAIVVVKMKGWDKSLGVGQEIAFAVENDRPIIYVEPSEIGL